MEAGVGDEKQCERSVSRERASVDGRHETQTVCELISQLDVVLVHVSHSL